MSPMSTAVAWGRGRRRVLAASVAAVIVSLASPSTCVAPASAELATTGRGRAQRLVRDQFPPEQQVRYDLFAVKCTQCHAMSRPIAALTTGITPVSGGTFDEDGIKRYVVRMMRKPNSGVDRESAREIILFLMYARSLAESPPSP